MVGWGIFHRVLPSRSHPGRRLIRHIQVLRMWPTPHVKFSAVSPILAVPPKQGVTSPHEETPRNTPTGENITMGTPIGHFDSLYHCLIFILNIKLVFFTSHLCWLFSLSHTCAPKFDLSRQQVPTCIFGSLNIKKLFSLPFSGLWTSYLKLLGSFQSVFVVMSLEMSHNPVKPPSSPVLCNRTVTLVLLAVGGDKGDEGGRLNRKRLV